MKCIVLIAVIHGLRAVGRRIGPRASGLILGLPSSTAIVLLLCGRARGCLVAAEMAESSLLGLVAAVSLPLAYAEAVRQRWRLPAADRGGRRGLPRRRVRPGFLSSRRGLREPGFLALRDRHRVISGRAHRNLERDPSRLRPVGALVRSRAYGRPDDLRPPGGDRRRGREPELGGTDQHVPQHVDGPPDRDPSGGRAGGGEPDRQGVADGQPEHGGLPGDVPVLMPHSRPGLGHALRLYLALFNLGALEWAARQAMPVGHSLVPSMSSPTRLRAGSRASVASTPEFAATPDPSPAASDGPAGSSKTLRPAHRDASLLRTALSPRRGPVATHRRNHGRFLAVPIDFLLR